MKTLNVTFEDKDFKEMSRAKLEFSQEMQFKISWVHFIKQMLEKWNNGN